MLCSTRAAMDDIKLPLRMGAPVVGSIERNFVLDALDRGWLARGEAVVGFEDDLGKVLNVRHVLTCNSGSSALLLCFAAARQVYGWQDDDEVIAGALGFPTTLSSIMNARLRPVLVDCDPYSLTMDPAEVEMAITQRTRAIAVTHVAGNPADMGALIAIADAHGLPLFEDACDALGSEWEGRLVGSLGDAGCFSFYASHHLATGEGGALATSDEALFDTARSIRAWGRCLQVEADHTELIDGKRLDHARGLGNVEAPVTYDAKFTYDLVGFNLKMPELSAALGRAQMTRLAQFGATRRRNYAQLVAELADCELVTFPREFDQSRPSWMFACLLLSEDCRMSRLDVCRSLEPQGVETRPILAGNLARQPAFRGLSERKMLNADRAMERGFCVGVHPGLNEASMSYMASCIRRSVGASVRHGG
jgi:CDP-4-dehydro-6-deoxyglucose reductase, E1